MRHMQRGVRGVHRPTKPVSSLPRDPGAPAPLPAPVAVAPVPGGAGTRDRGPPFANIPNIQHACPQNAACQPDTSAQLV